MSRVANMSKQQSVKFIISLTMSFIVFLVMLCWGLILAVPHEPISTLSLTLIIVGGSFLFITIFFLALAALSSNYMKRKEKNNKQE